MPIVSQISVHTPISMAQETFQVGPHVISKEKKMIFFFATVDCM